jgi:hypothetical protein
MMPDQAFTVDMLVVKTLVTPTQGGMRLAIAPHRVRSDRAGPGLGSTGRARSPRETYPRTVNYSPRGEDFFGFDHAAGRRGFR